MKVGPFVLLIILFPQKSSYFNLKIKKKLYNENNISCIAFFMDKNELEKFDNWNKIKKDINFSQKNKFHIKSREIWYVNIGKNIGFESNGKSFNFKRPVIVLKRVGSVFFIATLTTKGKNNQFYFKLDNNYFNKNSYITLSQVRIIDQKRFIEKIGKISKTDFLEIKNRLKELLF